jgi:hypothetical protein
VAPCHWQAPTPSAPLWKVTPPSNASPLLIFVNTRSGGNQGLSVMRMFKGLLNPAQVFDLAQAGDNHVLPTNRVTNNMLSTNHVLPTNHVT